MKAVIMCGGMGTRMRPITDIIPKPLLQVAGREILDILIEELTEIGVDTVYLTLGYMGEKIRSYVEQKQYHIKIIPVFESSPLGTAGGVRNAVGQTMDDILVLSGDNIFSFDLQKAYHEHLNCHADVSLIGTYVDDPRDYGTVKITDNGSVESFIEKPSWTQAETNIINTGIYFLKGDIVSLIPIGKMFDFANDLFPLLMAQGYSLHCILAEGKWGDLGDISSYLSANRQVLNSEYGEIYSKSNFVQKNRILPNGTVIQAPCVIGERTKIGEKCKIGPFSVIGNDCVIEDECIVEESVVSDDTKIGDGCVFNRTFIGQNCRIGCFVRTGSECVLAGNVMIGNYVNIESSCKVFAGCSAEEQQNVSHDIVSPVKVAATVTASGVKGKPFRNLSLQQALQLGCAVASCKNINRIGVSDDGNKLAGIFRNVIMVGLQSCGATVYDFATVVRSQRVFFSQYCKLDFFISVCEVNGEICISFSGENACPVNRKTERALQAAFRYEQFQFAEPDRIKEIFFMNPLSAVYKSLLTHRLPLNDTGLCVAVECDNRNIYEMMHGILREKGYHCDYGGLLFMIDKHGEKFYAIENEHAYSHDRILTICCNYELEEGSDVAVNETAPGILETLAAEWGRKLTRLYEAETELTEVQKMQLRAFPWVYDGIMCIIRLIDIMQKKKQTLQQLSDALPDCFVKTMSFVYLGEPKNFKEELVASGAVKSDCRKGYYEWEDDRGTIKVKPDSVCRNIKVLIEAESLELSRELAADAQAKLKNCAIDKF